MAEVLLNIASFTLYSAVIGGQNVGRAKCMEGKMYGGQNEWRAKRQRAKCMVGKMYGGQNEWWAKS